MKTLNVMKFVDLFMNEFLIGMVLVLYMDILESCPRFFIMSYPGCFPKLNSNFGTNFFWEIPTDWGDMFGWFFM